MTHPVIALLTAGAAVAVAVLLLWPVRGWLWRGLRALRATERVAIEDALKHLFDFEYNGRAANLQSVSGALAVSGNRAAEILARLQAQELVELEGGGYRLTAEGRRYALRIVRVHRLWERYLSEETGLDPAAWHNEAERLEHTTSAAEADALAARMGHPSHDPHGDPIPTAGGEIGPPRGMPLTELAIGELAEIVHIEDEPEAIYAQLVAEGLHPGMRVRVNESTPRRVRFEADARSTSWRRFSPPTFRCCPCRRKRRWRGRSSACPAWPSASAAGSWRWRRRCAARSAAVCSTWASFRAPRSRRSCAVPAATRRATPSAAPSSPCGASRPTRSRSSVSPRSRELRQETPRESHG